MAQPTITELATRTISELVSSYEEKLRKTAISQSSATKNSDAPIEVTADHVNRAAEFLASRFARPRPSKWWIISQVLELVLVAIAGVGGGHLSTDWGKILFVVGLVIAGVLVAVRLSRQDTKS